MWWKCLSTCCDAKQYSFDKRRNGGCFRTISTISRQEIIIGWKALWRAFVSQSMKQFKICEMPAGENIVHRTHSSFWDNLTNNHQMNAIYLHSCDWTIPNNRSEFPFQVKQSGTSGRLQMIAKDSKWVKTTAISRCLPRFRSTQRMPFDTKMGICIVSLLYAFALESPVASGCNIASRWNCNESDSKA